MPPRSYARRLAVAVVCGLVSGLVVAVTPAVAQSGLASLLLKASDVPGYSVVSPDDETLTNPTDQGPNQAFISCARGHVLLDQ